MSVELSPQEVELLLALLDKASVGGIATIRTLASIADKLQAARDSVPPQREQERR